MRGISGRNSFKGGGGENVKPGEKSFSEKGQNGNFGQNSKFF